MTRREPAWRVTARELEGANEEERGEGDRVASYLITPWGGRLNRVLVGGTLSPAEPVGRDPTQPFWRARLTDPTASIAVTAGSFQPAAMAQLRGVTGAPAALVVGKVHLYRGRDGTAYVSVRAEAIRKVPEAEERACLAEAVAQTLDRLDLLDRLARNEAPGEVPSLWLRAAEESRRRYPSVDRGSARSQLAAAVRHVGGTVASAPLPLPSGTVRFRHDPPAPSPSPPSAADRADEALVLDLLDQVAEASLDSYADRRELLARVAAQGLPGPRAEEVLSRLEDDGTVEEPIVGKLRLSDRVE